MNITERRPTYVGEILLEEFLEPLDLNVTDLARILSVHRNTASSLINNSTRISLEMAVKLSKAFNTTPEFWINLQTNIDLWKLRHDKRFQQSLANVQVVNQYVTPVFAI